MARQKGVLKYVELLEMFATLKLKDKKGTLPEW